MTTNLTGIVRPLPVSRFSGTISVPHLAARPATVHDLMLSEFTAGELAAGVGFRPHDAAARNSTAAITTSRAT